MGVHRLKQALKQLVGLSVSKGDEAVKKAAGCDIILFDTNDLVHEALETIGAEHEVDKKQFFSNIEKLLHDRIDLLKPKEKVHFFFDGGAAQAKIHQQRERRIKRCLSGNKRETFRNFLTAGTPLMREFEKFFKKQVEKLQDQYPHILFLIDGTCNIGEGEHKIRDALRVVDQSKRVCLYGKDGDLLFISLLTQVDTMIFGAFGLKSNIPFSLYDTGELRRSLLQRYSGGREDEANVIADLCLLLINLGNDYVRYNIPNITLSSRRKFSSICTLFDIYANSHGHLINLDSLLKCQPPSQANPERIFHLKNLISLLNKFHDKYRTGHKFIKMTIKSGQYHINRFFDDVNMSGILSRDSLCPRTKRFWSDGFSALDAEGKKTSWYKNIVYADVEGDHMTNAEKNLVNEAYWSTLCWTIVTYSIGVPSWNHTYVYKNAPLLQDFIGYLHTHPEVRWDSQKLNPDPYPYLTRLLSILPLDTLRYLFPKCIDDIRIIFKEAAVLPPDFEHLTVGGSPNVPYAIGLTNLEHVSPHTMVKISSLVFEILPQDMQQHFLTYAEAL